MTTNEEKIAAANNANANATKFDDIFEQAANDGRLHRRLRDRENRVIFRGVLRRRRESMQAEAIDHLIADGLLGAGSTPDDIRPPAAGTIDWGLVLQALIVILPLIARLLL